MDASFRSRKWTTVVSEDEDQRVVEFTPFFQLGDNRADVMIEASDFVVVRGKVFASLLVVDQERRDNDVFGFVHGAVAISVPLPVGIPASMRVVRGEPEEERFVLRPFLRGLDPVRMAATVAGGSSPVDEIEGFRPSFAVWTFRRGHVVLAADGGVITRVAEQFRKPRQVPGNRLVKFGGLPVVVRVAAGDDAGPAGAATAGREVSLIKTDAIFRQSVDVRRACGRVSVAAVIVPADVVGDEENNVGPLVGVCGDSRQDQAGGKQPGEGRFQSCHEISSWGGIPGRREVN